ncbi:molybdopterin-dependent oxidoreductase [Methanoplanus endosymbiosus]|uniref:Molybdopterin-dependent oxidoreductase n=1 Tax=Methanoplanus endosymbiosus TaxID=33865 RepID=A0A9E7TJD1_9EURY|nr:molybdopterin-dependent oxidoreductase [Methanoplanus endosymbiosus]UUX93508.1 molybdopterin-dependent oxidoreductase [Methanoplanus endosymbiosus]
MKRGTQIIIIAAVMITAVIYAVDLAANTGINLSGDLSADTDYTEIREYEGEKLSSVNDFRENSIKGPVYPDMDKYQLKISGLVKNPLSYTYNEAISGFRNHSKVTTLYCVEGWEATIFWEGISVSELIGSSEPEEAADTVIFHAYDGYTTSFPLEYITGNEIILAYSMNGIILPPQRGYPFQLVAEDKWGYKWIKWVTEIELSDERNYRGYWESRGYSNSADLNEGFFGN